MKRLVLVIVATLVFVSSGAFAKTYTVNLGIVTTPKTFHYKATEKFKEIVEKRAMEKLRLLFIILVLWATKQIFCNNYRWVLCRWVL